MNTNIKIKLEYKNDSLDDKPYRVAQITGAVNLRYFVSGQNPGTVRAGDWITEAVAHELVGEVTVVPLKKD